MVLFSMVVLSEVEFLVLVGGVVVCVGIGIGGKKRWGGG